MELGGSTSTLTSSDHAVFPNSELVSAATTSLSIALMIPLVELCGIKSTTTMQNFVEFRWRNLWQSTIYRSPVKSGWESRRVQSVVSSTQLGRHLEDPTVHLLRNSHIYHPSKFKLDPTVQTPGTFRLVHHFSNLFSLRIRIRPEFMFLYERDIGQPF